MTVVTVGTVVTEVTVVTVVTKKKLTKKLFSPKTFFFTKKPLHTKNHAMPHIKNHANSSHKICQIALSKRTELYNNKKGLLDFLLSLLLFPRFFFNEQFHTFDTPCDVLRAAFCNSRNDLRISEMAALIFPLLNLFSL